LELVINEGKIIDASFVEVPRQHNKREENEQIKKREIPASFMANPHKPAQKDVDARWTKKNKVSFFWYKNHVKEDAKSKLISGYTVTGASVHDSGATSPLPDEKDRGEAFYADSACTGDPREKIMADREMINQVCEKGCRNRPLSDEQKASSREKSGIRSRVEHIFGFMEMSMHGMYIQGIGIRRATSITGLMNLTCNMHRALVLTTQVAG
jgi:IS5 family transposase